MYKLCLKRKFIAQHYLIGGNWGEENNPHSHSYELELRLSGITLDQHNYLTDLVDVENILDQVTGEFKDQLLNKNKSFSNLNPSLELFSRILAEKISKKITGETVESIEVRLWENDFSWASWEQRVK